MTAKRSGRPKGSPNKITAEVKELARKYGPDAIERLAGLAGLLPGVMPAEAGAAQVAALREILDRAYGKATQHIAGDPAGAPVKVVFEWASDE